MAFILSYLLAIAIPPVFAQNYRQCYEILAAGKYSEAEKCFDKLIAQYPENAEIHYYLGQAMRKYGLQIADKQRIWKAIEHYQEAIRLKKNQYAFAWNGLGNAYHKLAWIVEEDDTDYLEKSAKAYQAALQAPDQPGPPATAHVVAHVNLAGNLREKGKFTEALEELQKAVQLDSKYDSIYETWGDLLYTMGTQDLKTEQRDLIEPATQKLQQAIEKYQQAQQLNSENAETYAGIGSVLMELNDYKGAIRQYQAALQRSPFDLAYVYNRMGNALGALGDLDGAINKYSAATQVKSLSAKGHLAFSYVDWGNALAEQARNGNATYRAGKWKEALVKFQEALSCPNDEKPSNAKERVSIHSVAHNNIGLIYWQQGNLETAMKSFENAIGKSPRIQAARNNFKEVDRLIKLRTKRPISLESTQFLPANSQTQIKRSIVHVSSLFWTNGGVEKGTGWIVRTQENKAWIITNKHVIAKGSNADEIEIELYYGNVPEDVIVPRITARIIERTSTKNDPDLALLEVQSPEFPNDIHHLSMFDRVSQKNDAISIVGNTNYQWVNGTVVSTSTTTSTLTPRLEKGYSGSPVLNPQNQVVGLLYLVDPEGKPHSYAHPVSLIASKIQEWIKKQQ